MVKGPFCHSADNGRGSAIDPSVEVMGAQIAAKVVAPADNLVDHGKEKVAGEHLRGSHGRNRHRLATALRALYQARQL